MYRQGLSYPFVSHILQSELSEASYILEIGCGSAVYRPLFAGKFYLSSDVPNSVNQRKGDVDVYASGDQLPFLTESFELMFSQAALDYMPNRTKVLQESYRVLRPGGRLLVFTYKVSTLKKIHAACEFQNIPHYGIYDSKQILKELDMAGFLATEIPKPPIFEGNAIMVEVKKSIACIPGLGLLLRRLSNWRIFLGVKPQLPASE